MPAARQHVPGARVIFKSLYEFQCQDYSWAYFYVFPFVFSHLILSLAVLIDAGHRILPRAEVLSECHFLLAGREECKRSPPSSRAVSGFVRAAFFPFGLCSWS